jgi:hypothetical protein
MEDKVLSLEQNIGVLFASHAKLVERLEQNSIAAYLLKKKAESDAKLTEMSEKIETLQTNTKKMDDIRNELEALDISLKESTFPEAIVGLICSKKNQLASDLEKCCKTSAINEDLDELLAELETEAGRNKFLENLL